MYGVFPHETHVMNESIYYDINIFDSHKNLDPSRNYASQITRGGSSSIKKSLSPWWISGFVDAEGSFGVSASMKETSMKTSMQFKITQKSMNKSVLEGIVDYFGVGKVHTDNSFTATLKFQIQDIPSIREKVIPHFDKYPLMSSKYMDYTDWKNAVQIIYDKEHLNQEGQNKILEIKDRINNSRNEFER